MKKLYVTILLILLFNCNSWAQTADTTIHYSDLKGDPIERTVKDDVLNDLTTSTPHPVFIIINGIPGTVKVEDITINGITAGTVLPDVGGNQIFKFDITKALKEKLGQNPSVNFKIQEKGVVKKELKYTGKLPQGTIDEYAFVPNDAEEKEIEKNVSQKSITGNTKWVINYDFKNGNYSYSKYDNDGVATKKNTVRPGVKRNLKFNATNYNPYRDSLSINFSFKNRNTELQSKFLEISGLKQLNEGGSASEKPSASAQSGGSEELLAAQKALKLEALAKQLKNYYLKQLKKSSLDVEVIEQTVDLINSKISVQFGEPVTNMNDLINLGKSITDKLSDKAKTKAEQDLANAILYYRKLNTINSLSFDAVQITNSDVTSLNFQRFKDGKPIDTKPQTQEFLNAGGFKLDFSSGLFWSDLFNREYTTKKVSMFDTAFYVNEFSQTTDSVLGFGKVDKDQIIQDDKGKWAIGLSLMSHFYYRTGHMFNVAVSLGFAIDNNALSKYLAGISLLLGDDQRLVLSGGGAFGKVKKLASGLNEGDFYSFANGQTTTIPTRDVWDHGWFLALTYNFGGLTVK